MSVRRCLLGPPLLLLSQDRCMHFILAAAFFFQAAAAADTAILHGARGPAFAPDGRLAVSVDGDLFAQESPGGHWIHITTGIAWDRDPAWMRDGSSIVFSSDRSGRYALWHVKVNADGDRKSVV